MRNRSTLLAAALLVGPLAALAASRASAPDAPAAYLQTYLAVSNSTYISPGFDGGSYNGATGCTNDLPCAGGDAVAGDFGESSFNRSGTGGPFAEISVSSNDPGTIAFEQAQVVYYIDVLSSSSGTATLHIDGAADSSYAFANGAGSAVGEIGVGAPGVNYYVGGSCADHDGSCTAFSAYPVPSGPVVLDSDFEVPTNTVLSVDLLVGINLIRGTGPVSATAMIDPLFSIAPGTYDSLPDAQLWISPDAVPSAVPEPTSATLMALACVAFAGLRRRRIGKA